MLITKNFIGDMLKNAYPNIKIIDYEDCYFDDKTFIAEPNHIFVGVLNVNQIAQITNLNNQLIEVSGSTNPVVFKNIEGVNFTFMGFKIEANLIA